MNFCCADAGVATAPASAMAVANRRLFFMTYPFSNNAMIRPWPGHPRRTLVATPPVPWSPVLRKLTTYDVV
jgi:hypothetical protein